MVGSTELIVIVLIIFILFGAKSIPKFAKSIGEARKELQKGLDGSHSEDNKSNESNSDNNTSDESNDINNQRNIDPPNN